MFLTKYSKPIQSLGRVTYSPLFSFDSLFDQAFDRMTTSYQSRLKLNENDSQYELTLELPGYSNKDVEVSVEDYVLTIKASNDKRGETLRKVSLWEGIDFEKVTGKIEDGVLTVKLPKVEKVKPKKIQIE